MLLGRERETAAVAELLGSASSGHGGGLILHGEPGIGKSAMLSYAEHHAQGFLVLRASGVAPEADLPYATVHRLLLPMLDRIDGLPEPQARAFRILFGLADGPAPNPFLIGLSTLSLLSMAGTDQPVLCVLDDAHWADEPTLQTLAFVARRLDDEPIALALAARPDEGHRLELPGLAQLDLAGLDDNAARELLGGAGDAELTRLLAATGGNPLALQAFADKDLAGMEASGTELSGERPWPLADELHREFLRRASSSHPESMPLLLLVAADGSGQLSPVLSAAHSSGLDTAALTDGGLDDLVTYDGTTLEFRHPLVRSAIYYGASAAERSSVHRALAAAFDAPTDQHRRAWHLGQAAVPPDEEAASELERSAEQAARRGGPAAAIAALTRAAELSTSGHSRGRRLVIAARAALRGSHIDRAFDLLDRAEQEAPSDLDRIITVGLRASAENLSGSPETAFDLLGATIPLALRVMPSLATHQILLYGELGFRASRSETWQDILGWLHVDRSSGMTRLPSFLPYDKKPEDLGAGGDLALSELDLPETSDPAVRDSLLRLILAGCLARSGREPDFTAENAAVLDRVTDPVVLTWSAGILESIGEQERARKIRRQVIQEARNNGGAGVLAWALECLVIDELLRGRLGRAAAYAEEGLRFALEVGQLNTACRHRSLLAFGAALQGEAAEARKLAADVLADAGGRHLQDAFAYARRALGLLDLVAGKHGEAARHFEAIGVSFSGIGLGAIPDLVEALVRNGEVGRAADVTTRFADVTAHDNSPATLALAARCRGLISSGDTARAEYLEALRLHALADNPMEQARTALLLGQHLRRERRRSDAQPYLRDATETFRRIGAPVWADRAHDELRATGESARPPEHGALTSLTPQELRITLAVGEGLTNREIAAQLFLSPRTVDYHLRKVFQKAGLSSRAELMRLVLAAPTG